MQLADAERSLDAQLAPALRSEVTKNLDEKCKARLPMSASDIARTVVAYEAFKLSTYVRAGVFPKRYFGYFDEKGDTAPYEVRLREVTKKVVRAINARQAEAKSPVRLTDIEVAVTFLAEGGAWFLGDNQAMLQALHPVFSVGLDDVAMGFSELGDLQARVDAAAGTSLGSLVGWVDGGAPLPAPARVRIDQLWLKHANGALGPHAYLRRYMTFEEAIAATALMYTWEKEIAERKLREQKQPGFGARPLDEQMIIASLVYNSGLLHAPERWEMIRTFSTGRWLYETSEANAKKRWRLPVLPPELGEQRLIEGDGYAEQGTSWLAVYHVLQRYGAFVALRRFTSVFDDAGNFAR